MTVPTIFETSRPREDVLKGTIAEADFAADLAQVVAGRGGAEYLDPARFFARTWPTRGLRNLLANVGRRLTGAGGEAAAIFRLDTSYGGGKTHGLIALVHAARGMRGVANVAEFVEPALVPAGPVRIAAFDGENVDPGHEPVRQEVVTRLQQSAFTPAITRDVAAGAQAKRALAQEIDAVHHRGMPPYAGYVARTILTHTFAFNDPLKGLSPEQLRYSVPGPAVDVSFVEEARRKFIAESAYLDDRPGAPMRFLAEANLSQIVRRAERYVDAGEVRAHLNDRIREIFGGRVFEMVAFPGGPFDVPDEVGDGRPKLVIMDEPTAALAVREVDHVLDLIRELKRLAITVILISHRLTDVFAVCDRIMALRQGEVIADEPTAETTMNRVVAHIVGADDGANERAGEPPGGGSVKCS